MEPPSITGTCDATKSPIAQFGGEKLTFFIPPNLFSQYRARGEATNYGTIGQNWQSRNSI